jgi:hypothetical protein
MTGDDLVFIVFISWSWQPQIARAPVAQPIRQRRLAALKGQDDVIQAIQGNGDFHN